MKLNIRCNKINKLIALEYAWWGKIFNGEALHVKDGIGRTWVILRKTYRGISEGEWKYFSLEGQWLPMNPENRHRLLETIMYYHYLGR